MSQRGLSPEQVAEFNEVGYLVVPKLIPREAALSGENPHPLG